MNDIQNEPATPIRLHTVVWLAVGALVFITAAFLGIVMRFAQGNAIAMTSQDFYSAMTLHGLGMTGVLFTLSLITMVWNLSKEGVRAATWLLCTSFALILAGVCGLVFATMFWKFAPGWYMLYPLPFAGYVSWESSATGLGFLSVLTLGVAWLLMQIGLLASLIRKFGIVNVFGWQYLFTDKPQVEIAPVVLISAVSLGAGIVAVLFGAVFLLLNIAQWLDPSFSFDPLVMKNMVFLFGHTFINVGMYMVVGSVYAIMPLYSGRPWPTNKIVVLAWNAVFFLVLGAYGHHAYMDFVQPHGLHYLGQIASYMSMVPLLVVTIIGAIGQVYRSDIRWSVVPSIFGVGLVGWVAGGVPAMVDATIAMNAVFHNTLWVPAHFHTYALMGYVFFLLGFAWHAFGGTAERTGKAALAMMIVGGVGLVMPFYVGGWDSIPRRFASYEALGGLTQMAQWLANIGGVFGIVFLVGFLAFLCALVFRRRII